MKTVIKILTLVTSIVFMGCDPRAKTVSKITFTCKKPEKYLFINGVNNNENDAIESKNKLIKKTGKDFILLHNYSEGFLQDLIQAYRQKKIQDSSMTNFFLIDWLSSDIVMLDDKVEKLTNNNEKIIYSDQELKDLNKHIEGTKNFHYIIVSHSQGNMFAKDICDKATIQPEIHAIATPLNDKPKCEKQYYTFEKDLITYVGRDGNYLFNKAAKIAKNEVQEVKEKYGSQVGDFYSTYTRHGFENYIDHEQKPLADLLKKLPKKENGKPKVLIEWVRSSSGIWNYEAKLNGAEAKSVTCEDIVGHENKITIPFNPKNVLGYRFLVKVPGKDPISILRKPDAKSPIYALIIKRNENDQNGEEYILEDGGADALFSIGE